jgi:hypothetical protein
MRALARLRALPFGLRLAVVIFAALAAAVALLGLPPLPQPESYHDFADRRALAGIPNFGNVISNLGFLAAGLAGLLLLLRRVPREALPTRLPYRAFAVGLVLVAAGSAYYHWRPTTPTLYWDRLAMTVAFMALAAAIVGDRIGRRAGLVLLPLLLALGAVAATHWRQSELAGAGDLRLYLMVQIVPAAVLPLLVLLFADRIGRDRLLLLALALYGLAMLMEQFDRRIFELSAGVVSGHSLKHLAAALAGYLAICRLRQAGAGPSSAAPRPALPRAATEEPRSA